MAIFKYLNDKTVDRVCLIHLKALRKEATKLSYVPNSPRSWKVKSFNLA